MFFQENNQNTPLLFATLMLNMFYFDLYVVDLQGFIFQ